jgi:fructose-1,6-bisphosphatase II
MGGDLQARLKPQNQPEVERAQASGIQDIEKKYTAEELAGGEVVFAATGVTGGETLSGVHFFPGGAATHSMVLRSKTRTVRIIHATHDFAFKPLP